MTTGVLVEQKNVSCLNKGKHKQIQSPHLLNTHIHQQISGNDFVPPSKQQQQ